MTSEQIKMNDSNLCKRKREFEQKRQVALRLIGELKYNEEEEEVHDKNAQLREQCDRLISSQEKMNEEN